MSTALDSIQINANVFARFDKTTPFNAAQKAAAAIVRKPPPIQPTPIPSLDPRYWQNTALVDQHATTR